MTRRRRAGGINDYIDLGGSSVFGTAGPSGGDCTTQYASVKPKAAKVAKRGGLLRYRAYLRNGNKTLASIDELRLEVTLPAEVSVVSSSSNLKHRGVVGTAGASSFAWTYFNLTKHKLARSDLKTRVSTAATKGQVLNVTTTLYHERGGSTSCPQASTLQVRIRARVACAWDWLMVRRWVSRAGPGLVCAVSMADQPTRTLNRMTPFDTSRTQPNHRCASTKDGRQGAVSSPPILSARTSDGDDTRDGCVC